MKLKVYTIIPSKYILSYTKSIYFFRRGKCLCDEVFYPPEPSEIYGVTVDVWFNILIYRMIIWYLWLSGYVMLIILASPSLSAKYELITKMKTTLKFYEWNVASQLISWFVAVWSILWSRRLRICEPLCTQNSFEGANHFIRKKLFFIRKKRLLHSNVCVFTFG